MPSGLLVGDCASSDWAWLDLGCFVQNAGTDLGHAVTSVLQPVWIVLGVVVLLLVIILFAPNTKHVVPYLSFL